MWPAPRDRVGGATTPRPPTSDCTPRSPVTCVRPADHFHPCHVATSHPSFRPLLILRDNPEDAALTSPSSLRQYGALRAAPPASRPEGDRNGIVRGRGGADEDAPLFSDPREVEGARSSALSHSPISAPGQVHVVSQFALLDPAPESWEGAVMKSPTNFKVARSSPREGTGQIRRERHHDCLRPRDSRSLPCPRHLSPLTVDKRAPAEPAQNRRFVHPNQGALHLYAFLIKWQIR